MPVYCTTQLSLSRADNGVILGAAVDTGSAPLIPDFVHIVDEIRLTRFKHRVDFVFAHDAIAGFTSEWDLAGSRFFNRTMCVEHFERDGTQRRIEDHHVVGVFSRDAWLRLLRDAEFRVRIVIDPWKRTCFVATRPLRDVA